MACEVNEMHLRQLLVGQKVSDDFKRHLFLRKVTIPTVLLSAGSSIWRVIYSVYKDNLDIARQTLVEDHLEEIQRSDEFHTIEKLTKRMKRDVQTITHHFWGTSFAEEGSALLRCCRHRRFCVAAWQWYTKSRLASRLTEVKWPHANIGLSLICESSQFVWDD